ncbi:MAG: putative sulfate exporter family transporter [Deltaproteobacteria bacterium]|nr:putative sulfate exporter family transporter [Deltaproteobacteria bacterium]
MAQQRRWYSGMSSTEDWWAVWIGLFFVLLGFIAAVSGIDLTGWIVKFSLWVDISKAFKASHQELLSPAASLIVTYVIFSVATCTGAKFMKWNVKKYFVAWSIIFWLTVVFYIVGQNAYIAATELEWKKYGIERGLSIGGAYYIIALFAGLFIGNLTPKRFRSFIKEAAKPEWFIKVAIVCLGTKLGLKAIEAAGFAIDLLLAGCCATIAAYLLFWPLAYTVSRKIFKLSKEWSACLASAISICGVSASIATGAAIRARPIVPIMISSLVVVFAFSELVILPGVLTKYWSHEPIVAGASLGLTVKTDGADAAAGAILDDLIRSKVAAEGIHWDEGWILASAIMTKIWIDMFIGWFRFPKFVLGYFIAWFLVMGFGLADIIPFEGLKFGMKPIEGSLRKFFFMLTFTSIGIVTDFRELAKEGLGKLAAAYGTILVFIVLPIGFFLAWLFHHGMMPPEAK